MDSSWEDLAQATLSFPAVTASPSMLALSGSMSATALADGTPSRAFFGGGLGALPGSASAAALTAHKPGLAAFLCVARVGVRHSCGFH